MAQPRLVNPEDLYERAEAVARIAVGAASPEPPYLLEDIIEDVALRDTVFSTAFLSIIPLHATLDGCVQVLKSRGVTAEQVGAAGGSAVMLMNQTDVAMARQWLAAAVHSDLDREQLQLMIEDYVAANSYELHPTRLPSLMRSMVAISHAALAQF